MFPSWCQMNLLGNPAYTDMPQLLPFLSFTFVCALFSHFPAKSTTVNILLSLENQELLFKQPLPLHFGRSCKEEQRLVKSIKGDFFFFSVCVCTNILVLAAGKHWQKGSEHAHTILDRLQAYRKYVYRAAHPAVKCCSQGNTTPMKKLCTALPPLTPLQEKGLRHSSLSPLQKKKISCQSPWSCWRAT